MKAIISAEYKKAVAFEQVISNQTNLDKAISKKYR